MHPPPSSSIHIHPAPVSSIHLHPAHFSLHQILCNTLNNIRTKILHVMGQFPQIWAEKLKVVHFDWKLGHMVSWMCWFRIQKFWNCKFWNWNFNPKIYFLGKFEPKKSKLFVLSENWHTWCLKDADSYSNINFVKLRQNPFLGEFGPKKSKLSVLSKNWRT